MRLDLRIAHSLLNRANNYIHKQNQKKKKIEDEKWNSLFSSKDSFVGKLNDTLQINFYKDSILSRLIYTSFEQEEIAFLRKFLKNGDTFLDIGSNIGLFSLHASEIVTKSGSVHAFEPTPKTYSRLLENIELNGLQETIIANNIGLSSSIGKLTLNVSSDGHDAWNTFAQQSEMNFQKKVEIAVDTLDNYLFEKNLHANKIALIKMDVEGWEMEVVKGAIKLLEDIDSPVWIIEFTESNLFAAGTNCYELYDAFVSYGYKWYTYNAENNFLVSEPKRIHYPYNNLIAIKKIDLASERLK